MPFERNESFAAVLGARCADDAGIQSDADTDQIVLNAKTGRADIGLRALFSCSFVYLSARISHDCRVDDRRVSRFDRAIDADRIAGLEIRDRSDCPILVQDRNVRRNIHRERHIVDHHRERYRQ